jgi:hypothetical protein
MRRWMTVTMLAAMTLALTASAGESAGPTTAIRVSDFLASLGVVVHMNYTDGTYANVAQAIEDLDYLGIHQLRDSAPIPSGGIPYRNYRDAITALTRAGNRFAFTVGAGQPIAVSLGQIAEIEETHRGSVMAIEGPNEINNWPVSYAGLTGDAAARAFQRDLYAAVKSNRILSHLPLYYFTGGDKIDLWDQKGLADYANGHPYPYRGEAPGPRIMGEFQSHFSMPYPRVNTEAGYFNRPHNPGGNGVDDATQAKLTLDLLLSAFAQGVSRTYLYQLRAAYPDKNGTDADAEYGLFNLDNTPKQVATAIHNLTSILADPSTTTAGFEPDKLRYALSGMPPTGNSILLQRSGSVFVLVVWAEPTIWNESTHSPLTPSRATVTANLGTMVQSVQVFDPLVGTSPTQTYHYIRTLSVDVADHPIVVKITLREGV